MRGIRGSAGLVAFLAACASFADRFPSVSLSGESNGPRRRKTEAPRGRVVRSLHEGGTMRAGRNAAKRAARAERQRYIAENRNVPRSGWKRVWRIREETARTFAKAVRA